MGYFLLSCWLEAPKQWRVLPLLGQPPELDGKTTSLKEASAKLEASTLLAGVHSAGRPHAGCGEKPSMPLPNSGSYP